MAFLQRLVVHAEEVGGCEWELGCAVLNICRCLLLHHKSDYIFYELGELLFIMQCSFRDADIGSRARLYYALLAEASDHKIRQVLGSKLAGRGVLSQNITNILTGNKLITNILTGNKLITNILTGNKLITNILTGNKLITNILTGNKLITNILTGNKLITNILTGNKLITNILTGNKLITNILTGNKLITNILTGNKLITNILTGNKLITNILTGKKLNTNILTGNKLITNILTGNKLITNILTGKKLITSILTGKKLITNILTGNKLITNILTGKKLITNILTGNKLITNILTGKKLNTNILTGNKLITNILTGNKLITNILTGKKLITNILTGKKLITNILTGKKLITNILTGKKLITNILTGKKLITNILTGNKLITNILTGNKLITNILTGSAQKKGKAEIVHRENDLLLWERLSVEPVFTVLESPSELCPTPDVSGNSRLESYYRHLSHLDTRIVYQYRLSLKKSCDYNELNAVGIQVTSSTESFLPVPDINLVSLTKMGSKEIGINLVPKLPEPSVFSIDVMFATQDHLTVCTALPAIEVTFSDLAMTLPWQHVGGASVEEMHGVFDDLWALMTEEGAGERSQGVESVKVLKCAADKIREALKDFQLPALSEDAVAKFLMLVPPVFHVLLRVYPQGTSQVVSIATDHWRILPCLSNHLNAIDSA
ncbi:hypothetical protein ACOMHN_003023 [Nucella lapillus]